MKRYTLLLLVVLILLFASACVAKSQEEAEAAANYVQAKADEKAANARLAEAQVIALELQNANNAEFKAQQLALNLQSWEAKEARLDNMAKSRELAIRVLAFAIAVTVLIGGTIWIWANNQVKLLEAERQVYEARITSIERQHNLLIEGHESMMELAKLAEQNNGKIQVAAARFVN